jgi:uncharacterized membrane protein YkvA (DUF1232 family)
MGGYLFLLIDHLLNFGDVTYRRRMLGGKRMKGKYLLSIFLPKAAAILKNRRKTSSLLQEAGDKAGKNKVMLKDLWHHIQLLVQLMKAWLSGEYTRVPYRSLVVIVASILYFVSPVDMIPDFLFGMGLLDDAVVITFALKQIEKDVDEFKKWKEERRNIV